MVLYLLGIPIAIAAAKMLHDDVKYTAMDLRIDKASSDVNVQYKQIEKNFVDILKYSGARCDIKKKGYDKYEINNVQKGQYGGMEKYLGEKGFYPQAINHAKKLFDDIADKESRIKNQKRDERIDLFERKLLTEKTKDIVITIQFNKFSCNKSKILVEKDVEKLIDYFHTHNNENAFCNIIMENDNYWHHQEVWHIKVPISENGKKYYNDVYDKIIINNYPISTNNKLHEPSYLDNEYEISKPKASDNSSNTKDLDEINMSHDENKNNTHKSSFYYYNLGFQYKSSSQKEKAIKYFKKALEIDPNFSTALEQLGYTLEELERYKEAIECLERVDYDYGDVSRHIRNCRAKLKESKNSPIDTKNEIIKPESSDRSLKELDEINMSHKGDEDNNELNTIVSEEDDNVNYLSKIKEAKELLDDGAITQDEYEVLKRKFLDLI